MAVTVLCRAAVGCAYIVCGPNADKEGETVKTAARVFCILSILMVLWLFLCVACYHGPGQQSLWDKPEEETQQELPGWLRLEHRQKINFKQYVGG